MTAWINVSAVVKILVLGVLVGAGLPTLFAVGARLHALGSAGDGAGATRSPMLIALSWVLFALVVIGVVIGVLFVARDFIGHHTGLYILGAKHR
ncbi:hypothetical protein [Mycobacterium sp. RTGN5]|uniref:hypothetical protein n=1 Tax=Mycobacterium sp. RTGN5 TaxID=3016522 RepID=UPI0029C70018|nr:hypothetical protein [Mycobacterium sp. RTGN5]